MDGSCIITDESCEFCLKVAWRMSVDRCQSCTLRPIPSQWVLMLRSNGEGLRSGDRLRSNRRGVVKKHSTRFGRVKKPPVSALPVGGGGSQIR